MNKKTSLEIVQEHLDPPELLTQLAEEFAEAAQAALKLRRARTGTNPTPVSEDDAFQGLMEEIADISCCLSALRMDTPLIRMQVQQIAAEKMARWAGRLAGKDGGDGQV